MKLIYNHLKQTENGVFKRHLMFFVTETTQGLQISCLSFLVYFIDKH